MLRHRDLEHRHASRLTPFPVVLDANLSSLVGDLQAGAGIELTIIN
jgi:hypothetical protein